MRHILLVLMVLGLASSARAADAPRYRYAEPALGRVVFNGLIIADSTLPLPLRLPRLGRYYAELILEPPTGADEVTLSAPLGVTVDVAFKRGERVLDQRAVAVSFAPGERSKTLFWLEVPETLPQRTNLAMQVNLHETSDDQLRHANVRLQLTRKLDFGALPLWH